MVLQQTQYTDLLHHFLEAIGSNLNPSYPIFCDLQIADIRIPVATTWTIGQDGHYKVHCTTMNNIRISEEQFGEIYISYENLKFPYFITAQQSTGMGIFTGENNVTTFFSGDIDGYFGDTSQQVDSVEVLYRGLPQYLTHARTEETRILKTMPRGFEPTTDSIFKSRSENSYMILEDENFQIQLENLNLTHYATTAYKGKIYSTGTKKSFDSYEEVIRSLNLFLSWICGSFRNPAYVVGKTITDTKSHPCGYIGSFNDGHAPNLGRNHWFTRLHPKRDAITETFKTFSDYINNSEGQEHLATAIFNYAESQDVQTIESTLSHLYTSLSALAKWYSGQTKGDFNFTKRNIRQILEPLELLEWQDTWASLNRHRNNALHANPAWGKAYHSAIRTAQNATQLIEILIALKLGMKNPHKR